MTQGALPPEKYGNSDPDPGKVQVKLDWSLWCDRHLSPYAPRWPQGAATAMVKLFQHAAAMPAVVDEAKGDTGNLTAALQRFKPLCCFVGAGVLNEIYAETVPPEGDNPEPAAQRPPSSYAEFTPDESVTRSPREWFDQFPGLAEGAQWPAGQWCPRHWAPAALLGANGIGATAELMHACVNGLLTPGATPEQANDELAALGKVCCHLGDERMYEIWGHWPPSADSALAAYEEREGPGDEQPS